MIMSGFTTFVNALDSLSAKSPGENGSLEISLGKLKNIHDIFVGLNGFATHNYGASDNIAGLLTQLKSKLNVQDVRDYVFKLMALFLAHTRDCRKEGMGKGEREAAWQIYGWMWNTFTEKQADMKEYFYKIYSVYGSVNDINLMWRKADTYCSDPAHAKTLKQFLVDEWVRVLKPLFDGNDPVDLGAKYAPREKSSRDRALYNAVVSRLVPGTGAAASKSRTYRKVISAANAKLETTEIKMCGKTFADISYDKVPGRALHKYNKAFHNNGKEGPKTEEDRVLGATKYREFLESLKKPESKGAKGTSVFITELAEKLSSEEDDLGEAQWQDQVKNIRAAAAKNGIDLGEFLSKFAVLLDFSGSMEGAPMNLAKAMGAFIAPLQKGPLKNRVITFEATPHFGDLTGCTTVHEMLQRMNTWSWGYNTNFEAVHDLILTALASMKPSDGEMTEDIKNTIKEALPEFFLVVTDAQFDVMQYPPMPYATMHEKLVKKYADFGTELVGEPFRLPTMIYWNARGDTNGMPVTATEKGAMFISGCSTAVVKTFFEVGLDTLRDMTPWSYLEKTLSNEWYLKMLEHHFLGDSSSSGAGAGSSATASGAGAEDPVKMHPCGYTMDMVDHITKTNKVSPGLLPAGIPMSYSDGMVTYWKDKMMTESFDSGNLLHLWHKSYWEK